MNAFAEIIKKRRAELRLSLREFCAKANVDPSNWSKIERGLSPPPKTKTILDAIRDVLQFPKDSSEAGALFDAAFIGHGMIPPDIITDKKLSAMLPVFFRTVRGDKHTEAELRNLAEIIRDSETTT